MFLAKMKEFWSKFYCGAFVKFLSLVDTVPEQESNFILKQNQNLDFGPVNPLIWVHRNNETEEQA